MDGLKLHLVKYMLTGVEHRTDNLVPLIIMEEAEVQANRTIFVPCKGLSIPHFYHRQLGDSVS